MAFSLSDNFLNKYKKRKPNFGFNGLSELTYRRTYSRPKSNGEHEEWWETVKRVVEGTYEMQQEHIDTQGLEWNSWKAQRSAQEMYDRIFTFKFLPPGRGLWAMGTPVIKERKLYAALNNCAFVSTDTIKEDLAKPFLFTMDMLMLGVGVGFDIKGSGKITIKGINKNREKETYIIADSREGWIESVQLLIESFLLHSQCIEFDYSKIRKEGEKISGFGGTSSGPNPLKNLHKDLKNLLEKSSGNPISTTNIVDIMNLIGKCVVAGNVRRTAEISLGYDDEEYLNLKNYKLNPHREQYGWTSNNTIFAELGMDYKNICERIVDNGEPGLFWLQNAQEYSRIRNGKDGKDHRVSGVNPCSEQSLESYEMCCVSGDTIIHTRNGIFKIKNLVDKDIEVWNSKSWSKVIPFLAGTNKKLLRVTFSDGSYLDCTPNHEFSIEKYHNNFNKKEAKDLVIGDKLPNFSLAENSSGIYEKYAYEYGLFAGDGCIDKTNLLLCMGGDKSKLKGKFRGKWYKGRQPKGYNYPIYRISMVGFLNFIMCQTLRRSDNLPEIIFEWNSATILEFIAGYIDSDGNLCKQINTDNYRIFGSELKMRQLQFLCRRIGINHSSVKMMSDKRVRTNKGIRSYALWCLYIPTYECKNIPTRLKIGKRFGNGERKNNAHKNSVISYKSRQKVISIEQLEGTHDTYCFTEPLHHMGVFNNVITHQCLVENFPAHHDSLEDFLRTLKFSYLYAKTVTLGKTHWPMTNRVMLRNRRIGCSLSGIVQFIDKVGINSFKQWMKKGYDKIQEYDEMYSDWFAIPRSIKTTSIKPSGTVSLVAAATPGMHYPQSRFYIRRIQLSRTSPLINPLKKAGYKIEKAFGSEDSTVVTEIPVDIGEGIRTVKNISMWEQLSLAAFIQKYWADNQVSCTVTFDPETEGSQIEHALNYFQYQLKSISFLPNKELGAYRQMPYEEINEQTYKKIVNKITPIKWGKIKNQEIEVDKYCDSSGCEVNG